MADKSDASQTLAQAIFWSAPAERSGDGALDFRGAAALTPASGVARAPNPKRRGASLPAALQTLRARGRRASVWSACVFSAAFPRDSAIRSPGRFMEFSIAPLIFSLIATTTEYARPQTHPAPGRLSD
jgi:hypothetical protein